VIGPRSRGAPCSRCVPDSRISREDKLARAQRSLFEILRVGREDLPACHLLSEQLNRTHIRELQPQTDVVFLGSGEPPSDVCRPIALVAGDEDNLVLNVEMLSFIDGQPKKQKLSCIHSPEKDLAEEQSLVCLAMYSCAPHEAREGSMSVLIVADRRSLQEQ
jgi:hypothetical protein